VFGRGNRKQRQWWKRGQDHRDIATVQGLYGAFVTKGRNTLILEIILKNE
jgi:hypothetical protein